jgi:hypothetical protein
MDFNLIGYESSDEKAVIKSTSGIEVTIPIKGTLVTTTRRWRYGEEVSVEAWGRCTAFADASPVDVETTSVAINGNSYDITKYITNYCDLYNGTILPSTGYYTTYYLTEYKNDFPSLYRVSFKYMPSGNMLVSTKMNIDWALTLASVIQSYPSTTHKILGWSYGNIEADDLILSNPEYENDPESGEGLIVSDGVMTYVKDKMLNHINLAHGGKALTDTLSSQKLLPIEFAKDGTPTYDWGEPTNPPSTNAVWFDYWGGLYHYQGWRITYPGTITLRLAAIADLNTEVINVTSGSETTNSTGTGETIDTGAGGVYDLKGTSNTPPTSPAVGESWMVGTNPTGDWAGHAGEYATWNGSSWDFKTPTKGDSYTDESTGKKYSFDGTNWSEVKGNTSPSTGVNNGGSLNRTKAGGGTNNTDNDNAAGGGFTAYADAVNMTLGQYNLFLAAGGGVITENGIFPNGSQYYIDNIDLSMDGNTMRVIQVSKFDEAALLTDGSRIYGYILNVDGDRQPVFAGFVKSHSRSLTEKDQSIVYECVDLKNYLEQFITPLLYRQADRSIHGIADDILKSSGIRFQNNLPTDLTIDVEYQAETLPSVLDYLCQLAGDYHYWMDRNGDLIIDEYRATPHSFRVPTEGEAKGTNVVESFKPVTDMSNSRSRIVVSGGTGSKVTESGGGGSFRYYGHIGRQYNSLADALAAGASGNVLVRGSTIFRPNLYIVTKISNAEPVSEIYGGEFQNGRSLQGTYTEFDRFISNTVPVVSQSISVSSSSQIVKGVQYAFFSVGPWAVYSETTVSGPGAPGTFTGVPFAVEARTCSAHYEIAYKKTNEIFAAIVDTRNPGGTLVFTEGNAKYIRGIAYSINDTWILRYIANKLSEVYAPTYGGELTLDGLYTDIQIGDLVSLTNTTLPASESTALKVKGISYDIGSYTTSVTLADRLNLSATGISAEVYRDNRNFYIKKQNLVTRAKVNRSSPY